MRRRLLGLGAAAAAAMTLTGCPATPPPPAFPPPTVSVVMEPGTVEAGGTFTVSVTATSMDSTPIAWTSVSIAPPYRPTPGASGGYPGLVCEPGPFESALTVTQTYECSLPAVVPNGTWRLTASALAQSGQTYVGSVDTTFEVTGGFDDRVGPKLVSAVLSPNPVVIGEPFDLTMRASDDNYAAPVPGTVGATIVLPAPPAGSENWICPPATPPFVEPPVLEWRFTGCVVPAGSSPWTYAGRLDVTDVYGNPGTLSVMFTAVAPAP